jgi:TonB family protein
MSSILVVEQEQRSVERINQALGSEGWRVRVVPGRVQALQAAASEAPDLVLLSSDIPGAEELASSFQRSAGGPGVVVILPERAEVGSGSLPADDRLARPFTEQDLRLVVRRAMAVRRPGPAAAGAAGGHSQVRLTSQDIFGDVLAEVEGQMPPAAGRLDTAGRLDAAAAAAANRAAAPTPRPAPAHESGEDEMARRLEKTLSGVFGPESRPRPAPPPAHKAAAGGTPGTPETPEIDEIDALLSKTLSKLELPTRPKPPAAAPAPPARGAGQAPAGKTPAAAQTSAAAQAPAPAQGAPSAPAAQPPQASPASRPVPVPQPPAAAAPPVASAPAAKPAPAPDPLVRPAAAIPAAAAPGPAPAESTAVRRAQRPTGEVDISALEDLARPRRKGEASRSGVTAPAAGSAAAGTAAGGTAAGASRPPLQAVPPPAAQPTPRPAAPQQGSRSGVAAADVAATQRIPVMRGEAGNKPGERFGQYTLLEKIAVGGMAEVWKARMRGVEGFQKTVAIKKILPYMTDSSEFVTMFIDEAKLAAQLSHPNIVHIYDLGKIGRDFYIAMEYVDGKDLRSLLNGARRLGLRLPFGLALLIAARLAGALEYAHNKRDFEGRGMGLVHRDVSPQNVLLSLDGDVKLCDFGIAKAVSKAGQTQMGALKGKLQYMSPEQAWGKPVDHRSDIFSLGAVLFELLTGERLFSGDTEMSVLDAVRQSRVRSPRQLDPTIPREVDEMVVRALASLPEERFQSAGELEQRLEAVLYALKPSPSHSDLAALVRQVTAGNAGDRPADPQAAAAAARSMVAPVPAAAAVPATPQAPPTPPMSALQGAPSSLLLSQPAGAVAASPGSEVAPLAPVGEVRVDEGGRRSRMILVAAIAALLVLAVGTFFVLNRRKTAPSGPPKPGVAGPVQAPAATPNTPGTPGRAPAGAAAAPAGGVAAGALPAGAAGTAGAAKAPSKVDVAGMVGQEVAKQAEAMKQKLEDQKKQLEKQIAQAEAGKGSAKQAPAAAAAAASSSTSGTPGAAPGSESSRASSGASTPPAGGSTATAPSAGQPAAAEAPARAASPAAAQQTEGEAASEGARGQAARRAEPAAAVKLGELVNPGPGVIAPVLVSAPKPEYPPVARKLGIQGVVVVAILVDENGHVEDVKVSESASQKVGLNEAAIAAARSAQYKPATKDGVRVKMWTRLKIPFKL